MYQISSRVKLTELVYNIKLNDSKTIQTEFLVSCNTLQESLKFGHSEIVGDHGSEIYRR